MDTAATGADPRPPRVRGALLSCLLVVSVTVQRRKSAPSRHRVSEGGGVKLGLIYIPGTSVCWGGFLTPGETAVAQAAIDSYT